MATGKMEVRRRITGKMYCEAVEPDRTSFVVGMLDMLSFTSLYVAQEHKPRFDAITYEAGKYKGDELRKRFDQYMDADSDRELVGAAACFFRALNEWSGFGN